MLNRQDAKTANRREPNQELDRLANSVIGAAIEVHRMLNRQDAKTANRREPNQELDRLANSVIGAAIEVHRILGPGYLESIYEEAMCIELRSCGIPFVRQPSFAVAYKNTPIGKSQLDLLVGGVLVVELKAVERLMPIHSAQVISYLKATGHHLGLLLNFNVRVLRDGIKRVILS